MTPPDDPPNRRGIRRRVGAAVRPVVSVVGDVLSSSRAIDLLEALAVSFVISGLAWNIGVGYGVVPARWFPPLTLATTLLSALWLRYLDTVGDPARLPS